MKSQTLSIRLDAELEQMLERASLRSGLNKSELARQAIKRQLRLEQFEELRRVAMPFAEERGWFTDEDIFNLLS